MKGQLEDLAFSHTNPQEYRRVASLVAKRGAAGREFVDRAIQDLETEFKTKPVIVSYEFVESRVKFNSDKARDKLIFLAHLKVP